MKDLPHHIKKLNRQIMRSLNRELMDEEAFENPPPRKQTERQVKKQAKARARKEKLSRPPTHPTPEERNRQMKHRVPVFDSLNHPKPKVGARPTHKKTPRI
ncbi:MAG: hypothetical protein KGJ02_05905 [Verrucomicrobiota bacterium]|nr:hypothetical protein [Verrucomicrobiota bacterium]